MKLPVNRQLDTSKLMRTVALICVLLALLMTGVEATHAHSEASISGNSAPCAICLSAHAKAPTVTIQFLPQISTVETVAVTYESQGKSAAPELTLFIRPPPAA
ncbi:MAG TPA: hypothetical protein VGK24_21370 [Candidatus Angelobacter sp.]|jgi:hypothetical protein